MILFKIFNVSKKAYWRQDQRGYTNEVSAGRWELADIASIGLDDEQVVIPFSLTGEALKGCL
jgi:hypothetical protein